MSINGQNFDFMLYTPEEYGKTYFKDRPVSGKTIIRRIKNDQLPSNHTAYKVGRVWVIEVPTPFKVKLH